MLQVNQSKVIMKNYEFFFPQMSPASLCDIWVFFGPFSFLFLWWASLPDAALFFFSRCPRFLVFVCLIVSSGKD